MREASESIRKRVQAARNIQQQRLAGSQSDIICNADMNVGEIRQFCRLQDEGGVLSLSKYQSLMRVAKSQLKLSRTIADLARSEDIRFVHLAEALHASQSSENYDGMNE